MISLKKIIVTLVFILPLLGNAQELESLKDYDWEEKPNPLQYNSEEDVITTIDKTVVDFEYDEDGSLIEYFLEHQGHILNSDEKIEDYNKLYLPYTSSSSVLINMKARVIKANGEIIVLDDSKILTSKDEETDREYKYYAFEGIEKGSAIEYFYLLKKVPSFSGRKFNFQSTHTKHNVLFDLYTPNNLIFKFKSYNGLPEMFKDTNSTEQTHWELKIDTLEKLDRESQSAYNAKRQFIIYKLDRNTYANKYNISSYSAIAKNAYNIFYAEKSKSEVKEINKLIKTINCKTARNKEGMIRSIENYIKNTFYVVDAGGNPELKDISKIITNKIASYQGIVKIYGAIFNELEIKHQVVLTSNRFDLKFDKEFEAANFLTDYLIYFPDLKSYMSPTDIGSRLGYPPPELTNNYGMFIKELEINDIKTALAKTKFIDPVEYEKNYDEILIDIDLNKDDIYTSSVKCDRSTAGYYAANIQPYMNLFKEDNKKEVIDEYIKYIDPDINIISKTVYNDDSKYFGVEPFRITSEFNIDPFVESAGKNTLLKIGKLIGPQMEMYQEKERVLPVETQYKRYYHRVIKINVPESFTIKNLDDINIHNEYKEAGKVLMYFKSFYTFENGVLTITADEYYDMIEVPTNLYDTYRKIINSAADFNKVSLILE